jgi:hypothetical protein
MRYAPVRRARANRAPARSAYVYEVRAGEGRPEKDCARELCTGEVRVTEVAEGEDRVGEVCMEPDLLDHSARLQGAAGPRGQEEEVRYGIRFAAQAGRVHCPVPGAQRLVVGSFDHCVNAEDVVNDQGVELVGGADGHVDRRHESVVGVDEHEVHEGEPG